MKGVLRAMLFCCASERTEEQREEEPAARDYSATGLKEERPRPLPIACPDPVEESKEPPPGLSSPKEQRRNSARLPRIFVVAPGESTPVILFNAPEEGGSENRRMRVKKKRKTEKARKQPSQS